MSERKVKKTMFIILLSIGAILILAFVSLLFISGIFQSQKYLEPWKKTYSQKFEDPRIRLVSHGILAANGHNMQPWKVRLDKNDPNVFYLYADSDRLTNQVDPLSRQFMITQGTFLEYVKVSGDELGYEASIALFPDGDYNEQKLSESMKTKPVAKIRITKAKPQNNPLYASIFLPDTNREAYLQVKLTSDQVNQLEAINTDANMSIKIYQDKTNFDILTGYAMKAAKIEAGVSRVMEESRVIFRSNEYEKNKYRYGFSVEGQGTSGIMVHLMQGMVTLFPSMNSGKTASDMFIKSTKKSVDNTSAYAMITTKDNSRESQVKSGMLYSRFILEAHRLGIVMQPLSQVLEEYPEMKEPYNNIHRGYASNGAAIQMLVRVGKPTKEVPLSMRRDVMDFIDGE